MIVNNFVVAYMIMMVVSLGLSVPAAAAGLITAGRWRSGMTPEAQGRAERIAYLVMTFVCLGFIMRLFMVPLWFLTLRSLVSCVPGAMCMAGVHMLDTPVSFIATVLKFFIPLAYIYWLVLNGADRRIESQPFMAGKLLLLAPLAILMVIESVADMHFLGSVTPKVVSCCTSLFDLPRSSVLIMLRQGGMVWIYLFYLSLFAVLMASRARPVSGAAARAVTAVSSAAALIMLVMMLQTRISPIMMETPYHQCVFCLWQRVPDIAIASAAVITGLWLAFTVALLPDVRKYPQARLFSGKIAKSAAISYLLGTAWLTARCLLKGLAVVMIFGMANTAFAAPQVSPCQLTNPDQDTLRLFPERTNYRTEFIRTDEEGEKRGIGAEKLYRQLEGRLGDKWDPVWETKDIPYVFYEILKGPDRIGWIFGSAQGWPGADNMQIMCAFDLDGRTTDFYYQKIPSWEEDKLNNKEFYAQFIGLTLEHFYVHDQLSRLNVKDEDLPGVDFINTIIDPSRNEREGFLATMRAMKKILIYLDDFKFNNKTKKDEVSRKAKYLADNRDKIPLLGPDPLARIKKSFPDASRFAVDLISPDGERPATVCPVFVVYKDDVYRDPFVRGAIIGYVLPMAMDTGKGSVDAVLAVGAREKDKGKVVSFEAGDTMFPRLNGLSLVNFYTKDVLLQTNSKDDKLDFIAPLTQLCIGGEDVSGPILRTVRKGLIMVDGHYLRNYFKEDEITAKIREYLQERKKQEKRK